MARTAWHSVISVALVLFLLAGCSGSKAPSQSAASSDGPRSEAPKELQKLTVNVGHLAVVGTAYGAAPAYRLRQSKLFEQNARKYGYDLTVNWKVFPFAPQLVADAASGGVQIGTIATFPLLIQLGKNQPVHPLHVSMGRWEFVIITSKDGKIKSFEDLKGKTVGVAKGTTIQEFFEMFSRLELGGTPEQLGIKVVEQNVPVAVMPPGMDAVVTSTSIWLQLKERGKQDVLVNSFGITGPNYDGPLGKGAGHKVPSVDKSPFAPEGYVALRHIYNTFGDFSQKHPNVVKAWVLAYQQTIEELGNLPVDKVTDVFPADTWQSAPRKPFEEQAVKPDLLYAHRKWIWPTEGEIRIMEEEAKMMVGMGLLQSPLSRKEILDKFATNQPILKAAYEEMGKNPAGTAFTDPKAADLRGKPVWELSN